jgi:hypothetical protein
MSKSIEIADSFSAGSWQVNALFRSFWLPTENKKTKENKGFVPLTIRKVELQGKNLSISFCIVHRKGVTTVSDSRLKDKSNGLLKKNHTLTEWNQEMVRLIGQENLNRVQQTVG